MFQDIEPHIFHNEYKAKKPERGSFGMVFAEDRLLLKEKNGEISFPVFAELEQGNPDIYEKGIYLFEIDGAEYYLLTEVQCEGLSSYARKELREKEPRYLAFAGVTAFQLYGWYKTRRFCGKCGSKMHHDEKERMMRCDVCGLMEYPKISPAVIVAVTNGNKLLLSKYAGRSYKKYALIAGFAEIGETIEETVRREVMEEVGLKVKNITYYKSQPWSFTDTLLFGFFAELDGDDTVTLDEEELALAEWFEREDIPVKELNVSLTNEMIIHFKNCN